MSARAFVSTARYKVHSNNNGSNRSGSFFSSFVAVAIAVLAIVATKHYSNRFDSTSTSNQKEREMTGEIIKLFYREIRVKRVIKLDIIRYL